MVIIMGRILIYGVGINDSDSFVSGSHFADRSACEFYVAWSGMIRRCYSDKNKKRRPTYASASVCDEWLTFSKFKTWMERQDWQGKELDKDIIKSGNKIYCPEFCAFVSPETNLFVTDCAASRGSLPIGVTFDKRIGKFSARCRNVFTKKRESLGYYGNPEDAHFAWRRRKHELSCELAKLQSDSRVSKALLTKFICTSVDDK